MKLLWKTAGAEWLAGLKRRVCDDSRCHRWMTIGALRSRKLGVQMGDAWYCSYGCFHMAAQAQIAAALKSQRRYSDQKPRMTLGLELIARGALAVEQLRKATEMQLVEHADLGDVLVREGYATEAQVTGARASLWSCPVYNPTVATIDTGIHIPELLLESCEMLPMHFVPATNQLLLGFQRGVDYEAMYAIEAITGCKTQACLIKPSDFALHQQASEKDVCDGQVNNTMVISDTSDTANGRARILCDLGASLNAYSIKITRWRGYLWTRLISEQSLCDLMFKLS